MQKLVLYVHASNGVIRPFDVEITEDTSTADSAVLDSLAREIAAQIARRFTKSRAQDATFSILSILKHSYWTQQPLLAGVALKVPGIIEDHSTRATDSSLNAAELQTRIGKLTQQYQDYYREAESKTASLEKDLRTAQQQVKTLQARITQLQNAQSATKTLESELHLSKQQLADNELQLVAITAQRNDLLTQNGALEMQLQQARYNSDQQEQRVSQLQTEIEQVRYVNTNLENANKELERQIKKEQSKGNEANLVASDASASTPKKTIDW